MVLVVTLLIEEEFILELDLRKQMGQGRRQTRHHFLLGIRLNAGQPFYAGQPLPARLVAEWLSQARPENARAKKANLVFDILILGELKFQYILNMFFFEQNFHRLFLLNSRLTVDLALFWPNISVIYLVESHNPFLTRLPTVSRVVKVP